ncbi:TPA: thermonuclease family protein [Klebsiella pneumoniae]|nr:thermonuclease family protein [Klebsiella pneumoniae]
MKKTSLYMIALLTLATLPTAEAAGRVVKIIDGDTLDFLEGTKLQRVRLVDIDAPEKNQPFGNRAKQKLNDLIQGANDTLLQPTGKDRYGRILGRVIVKKCEPACINYYVNGEMVKSGFAWAYRYHGKASSPSMETLEHKARSAKRGLWSDADAIEPWKWRKEHD